MFRKIAIIMIINLLELNVITKLSLILLIVAISLHFHIILAPYIERKLNILEYDSLVCSLITLFLGMMYLTAESNLVKTIVYFTIYWIDIRFFLSWIFSISLKFFIPRLEKFYKKFSFFFHMYVALIEGKNLII